jgi:hypothetical protein
MIVILTFTSFRMINKNTLGKLLPARRVSGYGT